MLKKNWKVVSKTTPRLYASHERRNGLVIMGISQNMNLVFLEFHFFLKTELQNRTHYND